MENTRLKNGTDSLIIMSSMKRIPRKVESFMTIKEVVSSKEVNGEYESINGIRFGKVVVIALVENKYMEEGSSSMVVIDGDEPMWVKAYEEHAHMIEMTSSGDWVIIFGSVRYDKRKKEFYVTPSLIEKIPTVQKKNILRYWYLNIIKLRIMAQQSMPKKPLQTFLNEEGIAFSEVDEDWLIVESVQKPKARRIIRSRDDGFTEAKKEVISYFEEKKKSSELEDEKLIVNYDELLEWAEKHDISVTTIENILVELMNDDVIREIDEDRNKFEYQG